MIVLALDIDIGALGEPPAWLDPQRAIYDALAAIIRYERKWNYPRGMLLLAICEPPLFDDTDGAGKPPPML